MCVCVVSVYRKKKPTFIKVKLEICKCNLFLSCLCLCVPQGSHRLLHQTVDMDSYFMLPLEKQSWFSYPHFWMSASLIDEGLKLGSFNLYFIL